jgi:hypothetical protein
MIYILYPYRRVSCLYRHVMRITLTAKWRSAIRMPSSSIGTKWSSARNMWTLRKIGRTAGISTWSSTRASGYSIAILTQRARCAHQYVALTYTCIPQLRYWHACMHQLRYWHTHTSITLRLRRCLVTNYVYQYQLGMPPVVIVNRYCDVYMHE